MGVLDRAIDGYGAVVGIAGPPGIGKSRLTREVAAMASHRGIQVFTAFCESHTSQVPFHVVTKLFRAATGVEGLDTGSARALVRTQNRDAEPEDIALFEDLLGIGDPEAELPRIDPDARRRRLTALVNAASLATQTPAVYVIEDAHSIDESRESLFADFLTVVPQTPLLTLITYRPEYRGALAQVPGAQTLALAPLSDPETTAAHYVVRVRLASPCRRARCPLRGVAGPVPARRRQDLPGHRHHGADGGAYAAWRGV